MSRLLLSFFLVFLCEYSSAQVNNPNSSVQDSAGNATKTLGTKRPKSPDGAMLRSLALPGWGQFYNGQAIKGLLVIAGRATILGYTFYYAKKANDQPAGSLKRDFYIDRRNLTFWLQGAATLLSMLDAYIDAYLYDFDTGPELQMRIGAIPPASNIRANPILGLSLRAQF